MVEGFLSGLHRSPFKGFSVEFAEYRQYMPGDDLSTIDWKVYARSDRYYVKKFEEETNLDCYLLLDVSASMGYGSARPERSERGVTKLEYASMLAASLAYLMQRQRDAVGLTTFDETIVSMLPPSARPGHRRSILLTLDRMTLGHRTDVPELMRSSDALLLPSIEEGFGLVCTEAIGSRWPSTEHSTSSPSEKRSTSTSGSCSNAPASAVSSSDSDQALPMPTDDPSRAGFTNTGGASVISPPSRTAT